MASSEPELWFRPARVEDYEQVIALQEVNEGWDPLPYTYHKMMADPYATGIVGETMEGIVSTVYMVYLYIKILIPCKLSCIWETSLGCQLAYLFPQEFVEFPPYCLLII